MAGALKYTVISKLGLCQTLHTMLIPSIIKFHYNSLFVLDIRNYEYLHGVTTPRHGTNICAHAYICTGLNLLCLSQALARHSMYYVKALQFNDDIMPQTHVEFVHPSFRF